MKQLLSLITILIVLTACQNHGNTESTLSKQNKEIDSTQMRIALLPTMDCLPIFFAEESGIFDSLKLNARTLLYTAQMDIDTAICRGRADGAYSDLIKCARLQAEGNKITAVMETDSRWMLVVSKKLRINKLSHIADRTVAVTRFSTSDFFSDQVALKAKIKQNQIYRPQINNIILRGQMVNDNQVDAALLPQPWSNIAINENCDSLYEFYDNPLTVIAFADKIWQSRLRPEVAKLIVAYNVAIDKLNSNPHAADSVLINRFHIKPEQLTYAKWTKLAKAKKPNWQTRISAIKWLESRRAISKQYKDNKLITTTFFD